MESEVYAAVAEWHDYAKEEAVKAFGSWEAAIKATLRGETNGHHTPTLAEWMQARGLDFNDPATQKVAQAALSKVNGRA